MLTLAAGVTSADTHVRHQGRVNPVHHLLGTAAGWGGLPAKEATYLVVNAGLPVGRYELHVGDDVPVDAFWSISVYNADGFFEPNPSARTASTASPAYATQDGSITVRFGDHGPDAPNSIPITEGWNYAVRLYQPRSEILDGTWKFPSAEAAT